MVIYILDSKTSCRKMTLIFLCLSLICILPKGMNKEQESQNTRYFSMFIFLILPELLTEFLERRNVVLWLLFGQKILLYGSNAAFQLLGGMFNPWMLSKDVVLSVLYKVYLVSRVISLVDTVQYC